MALLLPLLLAGCWKLDDASFDTSVVPFDNPFVDSQTAVVTAFTPQPALPCPDGQPATFFVVHDDQWTTAVPVAIVFHSGAFDYVLNPSWEAPLEGTHYAGENRLDATWARERIFQLLGLWEGTPDPGEVHEGTLAAALVDGGIAALYPGNCWGDLWHNYSTRTDKDNDVSTDQFYRNGLAFGSWMFRILVDTEFTTEHGLTMPFTADASQVALLGIGDGGRVIPDLLPLLRAEDWSSGLPVPAVLMDSTPDDLSWYVDNRTVEGAYYDGLSRIFTEEGDLEDMAAYSFARYLSSGGPGRWPRRVLVVSSVADPQLPAETLSALKGWISRQDNPDVYASWDGGGTAHVFTNRDLGVSQDVRDFLFP
ncbi:MAG: hypothetical protein JXB39_02575 [Deltaproteobacteria bacterium]|nr:hypothetical protein [Deltaproteobacteria bacterium]